jgi:hypothetical protein
VRPLAEKSPAWTNDYDLLNGTYTFALGDLDQDGAYEIIETATYNYPYAGQATVRDGQFQVFTE